MINDNKSEVSNVIIKANELRLKRIINQYFIKNNLYDHNVRD